MSRQTSARCRLEKLQPPGDFAVALAAYSHGIKVPLPAADLIFVAGQIALDGKGRPIAPGSPARQTEYIFRNIRAILKEAGATIHDVVKAQIFLTDMNDYQKVSAVRNRYFARNRPVSTLVQVSRLARDGCCVEIEVIAIKPRRS